MLILLPRSGFACETTNLFLASSALFVCGCSASTKRHRARGRRHQYQFAASALICHTSSLPLQRSFFSVLPKFSICSLSLYSLLVQYSADDTKSACVRCALRVRCVSLTRSCFHSVFDVVRRGWLVWLCILLLAVRVYHAELDACMARIADRCVIKAQNRRGRANTKGTRHLSSLAVSICVCRSQHLFLPLCCSGFGVVGPRNAATAASVVVCACLVCCLCAERAPSRDTLLPNFFFSRV